MSELDFGLPPPKPKKIHYDQKYSKLWENEKEFEGWIQASTKGIYYFYCKICKSDLTCGGGKYNIAKHASSTKHLNNLRALGEFSHCSGSDTSEHKDFLELINDDPLKEEYSSLANNEESEINCKVKKRKMVENNKGEFSSSQNNEENETNRKVKRRMIFENNNIHENNHSNKEQNSFEKWARKKKEMLEIELLEMRNYKMKLELWEKEQELQLSTSKYTRNIKN